MSAEFEAATEICGSLVLQIRDYKDAVRERIATACLQGLLANDKSRYDVQAPAKFHSDYARWAIAYADALIAELDKPTK